MRVTRGNIRQAERGFALWEMIVLLAVVAVFLAGVIVLASEGLESVQPENTDRQLSADGEALMDRLEALTREAVVIYVPRDSGASAAAPVQTTDIAFSADLDGDASGTAVDAARAGEGKIPASGRIEYVRLGTRGNTVLVAHIRGGNLNQEVILADILNRRDKPAFAVRYEVGEERASRNAELDAASPGLRVTGLHIYLKLADRGKTFELDREFQLNEPAPLHTVP